MRGRSIVYSPAEMAWIEANAALPRREALAAFRALFGREDVSLSNLAAFAKRRGWLTGRDGRFVKGRDGGKPSPAFIAGGEKTRFRKGQLPHTYRGPGHERIDAKDGYVVLIVAETNPWTGAKTRPVHKHRWLWEKAHGPIPKGHALKCVDGDKTNCDPSNWRLVPRALLPRLAGGNGRRPVLAYDDAPPELRPALLATAELEHAIRETRSTKEPA